MSNRAVRVIYLGDDEMMSAMEFPTNVMAIHWYESTEQIKDGMADIPSYVFDIAPRDCEDAAIPRLVDWLRRYTLVYLHRWGSDVVATDIRRAAENSNLSLPENHRVAIPTDIIGTSVGCRRIVTGILQPPTVSDTHRGARTSRRRQPGR